MTSNIGVERSRSRPFHVYCSCGSPLIRTGKTVVCTSCGKVLKIVRGTEHRVRRRRHRLSRELRPVTEELLLIVGGPLTFVLLFALFGPAWALLVSSVGVLLLSARRIDTTQQVWHHHGVPDSNRRFRWFGRLILLLAAFVALGYSVPGEKYREWAALADHPEPRDCNWNTAPLGDKHCHYESSFSHFDDQKGEHTIVVWRRVNDY